MTQAPTNLDSNHMASTDENLFKVDFIRKEDDYKEKENLPDSSELIFIESNNGVRNMNNAKETDGSEIINYANKNDSTEVSIPEDISYLVLPHTTILLETKWGSKVYVVGTAHFSEESQEDVAKVIRAVQPNFVVLELCKSRSYMLKWEEDEILKIADKIEFKMVTETIRTFGLLQGVMYLLLLSVSAKMTRELGMAPGGEFRRAYKEAINIPGCAIYLGDRPIEITLRRAFASLSWWQAIKFACYVIFSTKKLEQEDIEKYKNTDYLEKMLAMLGDEFPELKNVFVNERDFFLSYILRNISKMNSGPQEIVPNTVVGVVGVGHLAGIQRNWEKLDLVEFRRILRIPPPSRTSRIIKFTLKASILFGALYGVHKLASKSEYYVSLFR